MCIPLGSVIGGLGSTLFSTSGVSVESLVGQNSSIAFAFCAGLRNEGNDHGGKVATANHAEEKVGRVLKRFGSWG